MPLGIAIAVFEETPVPAELAARIANAVEQYLATVPHAEDARREYEDFIGRGELNLQDHAPEFLRWAYIERQAYAVARREIAAYSPQGRFRVDLELA